MRHALTYQPPVRVSSTRWKLLSNSFPITSTIRFLIIGADKLSSIVDWSDRNTCVLFGDGAGAAILRNRGASHGVIATHMGSDGEFTDILFMPGGGSRCPITPAERRPEAQHDQDAWQRDLQTGGDGHV